MDIPDELVEQLRRHNVVLLVGAGLSAGAGLPGWGALVRPLAERVGYQGDDLLKAAQFYENRAGRHALISYVREQLDTTRIEPTENHALLTRLPVNIVFTTNFDDLLEQAYRRARRPVNLVVGAAGLPYYDESKVNLFKLHGTFDRPDTFVITAQDYNTVYQSNALIVQQLSALLATKTFLFVGYSASDPDFNQIYDRLGVDLGPHRRRSYLVTFGVDKLAAEDFERRGFQVIDLPGDGDRTARLGEWLQALVAAVAGATSGDRASPPSGVIAPPAASWPPTLPWNEPYYQLPDRDGDIQRIVRQLVKKDRPWGGFVSGLGGIGKTATAIEIGRRCLAAGAFERVLGDSAKLEFLTDGHIALADARATLNFESLLNELGMQLDRPDLRTRPLDEKRRLMQNLLSQAPYLIIVDNLETAGNAEQIVRELPRLMGRSCLLITSREVVDSSAIPLELKGLSVTDSLVFLREDAEACHCDAISQAPDSLLQEIYHAVKGHPLALKLIVRQTAKFGLDLALQLVRQPQDRFYRFIYWDSWQKLSLLAQKVLIYLGKSPASLSFRDFQYGPFEIMSDDELTAALEQLIGLSLVNVIPTAGGRPRYDIHEITRRFINSDLPDLWNQSQAG
jgi:SIR2-like domain/NB-ARC domain